MGSPYLTGATGISANDDGILQRILGDRTGSAIERAWKYGLIRDTPPTSEPSAVTSPELTPIARAAERLHTPPPPPGIMRLSASQADLSGVPGLEAPPPSPTQPLPESIRAGAMNARDTMGRPFDEWRGVGGGPRSAAQMEQDFRAHDMINREYDQGVDQIHAEDQARGNPAELAIQARKRTLEMENMMPEYSGVDAKGNPVPYEPTMEYDTGQGRRIFRQRNGPTGPTTGEMSAMQRAIALKNAGQNPKDMLAVRQDVERQGEVGKLMAAKKLYDRDVAQGRRTREDADAAFESAVLEAAKKGALREGDFNALARLIYPSDDAATAAAIGGAAGALAGRQGR